MRHKKKVELLKKGWDTKEINHAELILERSLEHDIFFSKIVFWSAILVIVFANILVSFVLIPFLLFSDPWILYSITIIVASMIGFLYNFLITDIGHLERKHHTIATILVPIIAIFNMVSVVLISNRLILEINQTPNNPFLVAITFAIAFIIPPAIDHIRIVREEKKALFN